MSEFSTIKKTNEAAHQFGAVPINEYKNNEERIGDFEAVLNSIDAYDLSQSELANFQQDMNDAYLVLIGNPVTGIAEPEYVLDENGDPILDDNGRPVLSENSSADVEADKG